MRTRAISIGAIAVALLALTIGRAVGSNTVSSSDIIDFTIHSIDMHTGSVNSRVLGAGAVHTSDLASEAVARVNIRETTLKSLQSYPLISGVTVRGVIGGDFDIPTGTSCADNCDFGAYASLPFPAPVGLDDDAVIVTADTWSTTSGQTEPTVDPDDDSSLCTGSLAVPTAPAGTVCVYIAGGDNAAGVKGVSVMPGTGASPYGFKIVWSNNTDEDTFIDAVWAYTAP